MSSPHFLSGSDALENRTFPLEMDPFLWELGKDPLEIALFP